LILRKIGKIGATNCQILKLKCTNFDFHWTAGAVPDLAGRAYSTHQAPWLYTRALLLMGRRGRKSGGRKERKGWGK